MTDRELMQQALEALNRSDYLGWQLNIPIIKALRERLAQPEQTVSMTEYKRLQDLVTSQGIRLMEYESAQPEQVKFKCTVVDDDHPDGVPLSKWGRHPDQEPFCYHDGRNIVGKEYADHSDVFPLYTAPRQWQGLTDEEKADLDAKYGDDTLAHLDAIEAKLREKNA